MRLESHRHLLRKGHSPSYPRPWSERTEEKGCLFTYGLRSNPPQLEAGIYYLTREIDKGCRKHAYRKNPDNRNSECKTHGRGGR